MKYNLITKNSSGNNTTFCIYLKSDKWAKGMEPVKPLAWRCIKAMAQSRHIISWDERYSVCWVWQAKLSDFSLSSAGFADCGQKAYTLVYDQGYYFETEDSSKVPRQHVSITTGDFVNDSRLYVGLALNESPICWIKAEPNRNYEFDMNMQYFITFGDYENGMEVQNPANAAIAIELDANFQQSAELDNKNKWQLNTLCYAKNENMEKQDERIV